MLHSTTDGERRGKEMRRKTDRQTETERECKKETRVISWILTFCQRYRVTQNQNKKNKKRERERKRQKQSERVTHTHTHTVTHTQTLQHTATHTHTHTATRKQSRKCGNCQPHQHTDAEVQPALANTLADVWWWTRWNSTPVQTTQATNQPTHLRFVMVSSSWCDLVAATRRISGGMCARRATFSP